LINGILQIFNYATAIFGALMVDRLGRRFLFLLSTCGMTLFFTRELDLPCGSDLATRLILIFLLAVCTVCAGVYNSSDVLYTDPEGTEIRSATAAGRAFIAMIFLYYASYNVAMSPLLVSYTVEILPFKIRAKGLVMMNLAVNCSLVFNQYANPVALRAIGWKVSQVGRISSAITMLTVLPALSATL
jgi:MFS family permease